MMARSKLQLAALMLRLRTIALTVALLAVGAAALGADPRASQYYEDALVRYENKDLAGAIVQLRNALKVDNRMLPVHVLLGKALLGKAQFGQAEVAFEEALRLGVNRAEVVVPLAQALVGQARVQELVSDQKFSTTGLPAGIRAQLLLIQAAAHSDLGGPRDALKAIEEARAIDPNSPESWLAEIPVRIRARQFKEAQAAAERATQLAPASADALYLRGSIAHVMGNIPGALADYEKALALEPGHSESRIARAGLSLDQGRLDDTMRDVTEARRHSPNDPRAPYLGALVSERKGDSKASRAALANVTGMLDPVPLEFLRYKPQLLILGGLSHFGLGQNEKARPYLEAVVRQQPDTPVAKLLAQINLGSGNADRAIDSLDAYLKVHPADQQAMVLLATAQLAKGRHARAAQLLQAALKIQDSPRMRTLLGVMLVGAGKRADALTELENAYRRDPSQVVAGAGLVDLYLNSKQPAKAAQMAEVLVKRWPHQAQLQTLLGTVRVQQGDTAKARTAFEQALKLDASFLPAQVNLARLELQAGALDPAAKRLEAILAKDDKHVEALMELSRVAEARGKSADASRLLEKAADQSGPKELKALLALVAYYLRVNNVQGATEALARLNAKAPDQLSVLMSNASVKLAAKDLPGAQQVLTRASRAAEFDPQLQTQIAMQQLGAQDAKGALYSLTKALQGQPDFLPAKALLVDVNLKLQDLAAAEQLAREVSARNPNMALGHSLVGDVAQARGQLATATEAYRRAHQIEPTSLSLRRLYDVTYRKDPAAAAQLADKWIKANPRDADVRRMLADGYARGGNFAAARTAYEALVAQTPTDAEALNNLANILLMSKDPGALKLAERAMAIKPQAAYIVGTTGWAAYQAGQEERALELLRDARLRDPANADTRYFLGAVLASKGRAAEAREELQAALRGGGSFAHAKEADALLKTLR